MTDLMSILSTGNANIKLEITGEDLRNFSEELISRAVNEVAMVMQDNKEDCLLTKEETKRCHPLALGQERVPEAC